MSQPDELQPRRERVLDGLVLAELLTASTDELSAMVQDLPTACRRTLRERAALIADIADGRNRCQRCGRWASATGRENPLQPHRWHRPCFDADLVERAARGDARARTILSLRRWRPTRVQG